MLPSHGPPVKGFGRMIQQTLAHHQKRKEEIPRIMTPQAGPLNAFSLAKAMTWYAKGQVAPWVSLRAFDQRLAITEVMAHLEEMAGRGEVDKFLREGIVYYSVA